MNYVTYPHAGSDDADLRLTWVGPTMRAVGNGLAVLGGGILFAVLFKSSWLRDGIIQKSPRPERSCRNRNGNTLHHLFRHCIINGDKPISTDIVTEELTIIASPGDVAGARAL